MRKFLPRSHFSPFLGKYGDMLLLFTERSPSANASEGLQQHPC